MDDRRSGMGSTDVVEILGISPYEGAGPWRVWNRKHGVESPGDDETEERAWGHVQERVLVEWYARQVGVMVVEYPCERALSPNDSWLWATPDARLSHGYVEAKNVGSFMAHRWDRSSDDGIPHDVRVQVTLGMYCTGARTWTVVAGIGGLPPRIYRVEYDAELAAMAVDAGRRFWESVQTGREPPLDGSEACRAYLRAKWPVVEPTVLESTYEQDEIAAQRVEAAALEKQAAWRKQTCDAQLLASMGPGSVLLGDGWKMTWRVGKDGQRRSRFTAKGDREE